MSAFAFQPAEVALHRDGAMVFLFQPAQEIAVRHCGDGDVELRLSNIDEDIVIHLSRQEAATIAVALLQPGILKD